MIRMIYDRRWQGNGEVTGSGSLWMGPSVSLLDPTTTAGFCRGRIEALMSRRPPLTTSSDARPSSAIYLGDAQGALDNPLFTPPQDPRLLPHQLPSPPHTNSTSGSAGDKDSSSSGSIRLPAAHLRESLREHQHQTMLNGRSRLAQSTSTVDSEELDPDELTARLPDDRRESESGDSASVHRILSVEDRNRQVRSSPVV